MKSNKNISTLLLTTILISCGGSNTPDQIAANKARKGIASESNSGDPVGFTGTPDTGTPPVDAKLPSGLQPQLQRFLIDHKLQDQYLEYLRDRDALNAKLRDYAPSRDRDGNFARTTVQPAFATASGSSLRLVNQLYASRAAEFAKFDFTGDLTTAPDWEPFKTLGRFLNYFDPAMLDFNARRVYFPMYDPTLDDKRVAADLAVGGSAGNGLKAHRDEYSRYIAAKDRYQQTVNPKVTRDQLVKSPTLPGVDLPREKFPNLDAILYWGCNSKVTNILKHSDAVLGDFFNINKISARGGEILDQLFIRLNFHQYVLLKSPSLIWPSLINQVLTSQNLESLNFWKELMAILCYAGARQDVPVRLNAQNGSFRYVAVSGDNIRRVAVDLNIPFPLSGFDQTQNYYFYPTDNDVKLMRLRTRSEASDINLGPINPAIAVAVIAEFEERCINFLNTLPEFKDLFTPTAGQLSAGMVLDLTSGMTMRDARIGSGGGQIDLRGLSVSGVSGDKVALGLPLFVQMKGSVDSGKSTEAALGSVAYRLGNTVVGALQAYANRGVGFGLEGHQLESSVMVSHSFGSVFLEGQLGSVSASDVHFSDWLGLRSQVTLGLDTAYVSPFVQVTYRQLDRDGQHQLQDTTASVGLDMDIASLSGDTYHIDSRLLTKVGYGEKAWSQGSRDLGRVMGLQGSVEWSGFLNLNSGITFSTSLGLDTVLGSNAGITVRLEQ